jgi:hypothetical protein
MNYSRIIPERRIFYQTEHFSNYELVTASLTTKESLTESWNQVSQFILTR